LIVLPQAKAKESQHI